MPPHRGGASCRRAAGDRLRQKLGSLEAGLGHRKKSLAHCLLVPTGRTTWISFGRSIYLLSLVYCEEEEAATKVGRLLAHHTPHVHPDPCGALARPPGRKERNPSSTQRARTNKRNVHVPTWLPHGLSCTSPSSLSTRASTRNSHMQASTPTISLSSSPQAAGPQIRLASRAAPGAALVGVGASLAAGTASCPGCLRRRDGADAAGGRQFGGGLWLAVGLLLLLLLLHVEVGWLPRLEEDAEQGRRGGRVRPARLPRDEQDGEDDHRLHEAVDHLPPRGTVGGGRGAGRGAGCGRPRAGIAAARPASGSR